MQDFEKFSLLKTSETMTDIKTTPSPLTEDQSAGQIYSLEHIAETIAAVDWENISPYEARGRMQVLARELRKTLSQPPTSTPMKQEEVPPNIIAFDRGNHTYIFKHRNDSYEEFVQTGQLNKRTIHTIQLEDGRQFSVGDEIVMGYSGKHKIDKFEWVNGEWEIWSGGGRIRSFKNVLKDGEIAPIRDKTYFTQPSSSTGKFPSPDVVVNSNLNPKSNTGCAVVQNTYEIVNTTGGNQTPPPIHKGEEELTLVVAKEMMAEYKYEIEQLKSERKFQKEAYDDLYKIADRYAGELDQLKSLPSNAVREALEECLAYLKGQETSTKSVLIKKAEAAIKIKAYDKTSIQGRNP
jgi:hypothetical protein